MRTKYKHSLDRVTFYNRWRYSPYVGLTVDYASDWMIIGFGKRYFGPNKYEYILAFIGFEIRIWMKREVKTN